MSTHGTAAILMKLATECIISSAWEGLVLVTAVTVLLRMLRGLSSTARFIVWSVVSILLVVSPWLHLGHADYRSATSSSHHAMLALPMAFSWAAGGLWIAASLYRAAQLIRSAIHVRNIYRNAQPLGLMQRSVFDMSTPPLDRIYTSRQVDVPCVVGFLRPRILLPATVLEEMSPAELRQIVCHESEHIRRGDHWLNLLQKACLVVFPLNPALWWAERRLCEERELACDDRVLMETSAPKIYALGLAHLAEMSLGRRAASLMLGVLRKRSELSVRVHRIFETRGQWGRCATVSSSALLSIAIAGTTVWLSHMPSVVSIAETNSTATAPAVVKVTASEKPFVSPVVTKAPVVQPRIHLAKLHKPLPLSAEPEFAVPSSVPLSDDSSAVRLVKYEKSFQGSAREQAVLFEDARHKYAAFRLADGWLLIQL